MAQLTGEELALLNGVLRAVVEASCPLSQRETAEKDPQYLVVLR